jgi:hypothetical protein
MPQFAERKTKAGTPSPSQAKHRITLHIEPDLFAAVRELASQRAISAVVTEALQQWLDRKRAASQPQPQPDTGVPAAASGACRC